MIPVRLAELVLVAALILNDPLPLLLAGVISETVSHATLLVGIFHVVLDVTVTVVFDAIAGGAHVSGLTVRVLVVTQAELTVKILGLPVPFPPVPTRKFID